MFTRSRLTRIIVAAYCLLIVAAFLGRGRGAAADDRRENASRAAEDAWVAQQVNVLVAAAHKAYEKDGAVDPYKKVVGRIEAEIKRRGFADSPEFASRYPEFLGYVDILSVGHLPDHELGFNVPDKQYFEETSRYVQIPEFLTDQKFLHLVSRYETLGSAKAYLRRLNAARGPDDQLIFFSYTSQHLGAADKDNSFKRLLIVVPADPKTGEPDKWVQFAVTDPGARAHVRNTSVVSAVVGSDGTYDAYFKDFFRTFHRNGLITLKGRWELGYGDDNCAQCHKSGVLPIFPEPGSVRPDELPVVEAVNQRFMTYGSPRFGGYLDERKFGPGLSSASSGSRDQRFGSDYHDTAIGSAMACSGCHREAGLGSFNWPMDRTIISSFIEGGKMPVGADLKADERSQLYKNLVQEYFSTDPNNPGILKSWLLGKSRGEPPDKP